MYGYGMIWGCIKIRNSQDIAHFSKKKETVDSRAILTHISIFSGCSYISLLPKKKLSIPNAQSTAITHSFAAPRVACDVGMWWDVMLGAPQFHPETLWLASIPRYIYYNFVYILHLYIWGYMSLNIHTSYWYIIYVQHIHAYQKS